MSTSVWSEPVTIPTTNRSERDGVIGKANWWLPAPLARILPNGPGALARYPPLAGHSRLLPAPLTMNSVHYMVNIVARN